MISRTLLLRGGRGLPALLLLAASLAQAQADDRSAPPAGLRVGPLDAQARVPAVIYRSPLAAYRPLGDDRRVPWVEANQTVNRIGGWRTYLREAQQPDAAAPAPTAGSAPAPGGHSKH